MLSRYLKSNRGSALVLVLVTLSILSILGTALISLSVINFKMKVVDRNVKTSLYLAEAGLEEAYSAIGKVVEAAIKAGNLKVDTELPIFINDEKNLEKLDPEDEKSPYIEGSDGYGPVDESAIKSKIEEWFEDGYTTYVNDNLKSTLVDKGNNSDYAVADLSISILSPQVLVLDPLNPSDEDYIVEFDGSSDEYKISLQSNFTHKSIEKQLKARFTINIPSYNAPYYVRNVMAKMNANILMKKAITTEKDIYIHGDDVTINGDIYAYGTEPSNKTDSRSFGGFVVGNRSSNKSGSVTINGNIATSSYVHTNADASSIEINGDVFANSLVIQEDTENCSVTVNNGSVNTQDDIELNGESGNITINGNYYGFSDGSYSTAEHDESSSIVINSPDIGDSNGSSITITGNITSTETDNQPNNQYLGNNLYDPGVFLGGTVYVQVTGVPYQTGESVSLKGNYKAYSQYLSSDDSLYSDSDEDKRLERFKPSNVTMKNYPPLVLIDKYKTDDEENNFNALDKSEYIYYYNTDSNSTLEGTLEKLNLGGSGGINLSNILHSTGAYINQNSIYKSLIDLDDVTIRKTNDFLFVINKMWDNQYGDDYNHQSLTQRELEERVYIDDRFSYSIPLLPSSSDVNNSKEIIYVNDDSGKDLALTGPSSTFTPPTGVDIINLNGDYLQGIIVTKGDLYISGKINYRGIIVCEGNLYFEDDNAKIINNDLNYVLRKVDDLDGSDGKYDLKSQFVNNNPIDEHHFLIQSEAGVDDIESYLKYEDIIDIRWHKIK